MGGGILGSSPPSTVRFGVRIYDPRMLVTFVNWEEQYRPSDVGKTFVAPPEVVQGANQATMFADSEYILETGPSLTGGRDYSIPGHFITSVERIIDQLVISQPSPGGFYTLSAKQRIRFWGVPVPEPSTWALLAIGLISATVVFRKVRPKVRSCERPRLVVQASGWTID